ncbi:hypothetical protein [Aurantimonas sp. Leaf443]|uniref:PIN-like domain-containing protein n=1 Tax=Aurantimonas sp. Leaf443 TaxID=1736378 RepID=UPI0006FC7B8F|nr:hypothetical protein [Aurantimonas sp. Leaf443]KQT86059.1 hypothetical protein ASG48_05605 [Aurantimonas sp. Leaf443]
MKVLFDNCTSPLMATTLNGFIEPQGHQAIHLRSLPLSHPTDVEWIEYLAASGDEWLVITGDQRIRRNKAEARAFRLAKLRGVVLDAAYQKTPMNRCCAVLVHQWPNLHETMLRFDPPIMLEMGINFKGRFRQLGV